MISISLKRCNEFNVLCLMECLDWTGWECYRIGTKLLMFGFDNKKENLYGSGNTNVR